MQVNQKKVCGTCRLLVHKLTGNLNWQAISVHKSEVRNLRLETDAPSCCTPSAFAGEPGKSFCRGFPCLALQAWGWNQCGSLRDSVLTELFPAQSDPLPAIAEDGSAWMGNPDFPTYGGKASHNSQGCLSISSERGQVLGSWVAPEYVLRMEGEYK